MFMEAIKRCAGPPAPRASAGARIFCQAPGPPVFFWPLAQKCEGVERRKAQPRSLPPSPFRATAGRTRNAGHVAFRHSTAAISVPRVRVSWDEAFRPVHSPAGSLRKGHSAPRSGPEASRERGYEGGATMLLRALKSRAETEGYLSICADVAGYITSDSKILSARDQLMSRFGIDVIGLSEFAELLDLPVEMELYEKRAEHFQINPSSIADINKFLKQQNVSPSDFLDPHPIDECDRLCVSDHDGIIGISISKPPAHWNKSSRLVVCVNQQHAF